MMKQMTKRGFTLIELLVVIAIIGILASVVLASLNSARDKGETAAIKSNLNNIRAQAEIYYDDNDRSYNGVCGDPNVSRAIEEANVNNSECHDSSAAGIDEGWAAEAQLSTENETWYCVDSSGNATTTGAGGSISTTDAVCG